jgi:hypothetical protein
LAAKPHPGPTPKLSPDQKQNLVAILKAGPIAAGFKTDLWTCARVAKVVRKKFRVSYHPDHLGRILHDLGFSPQNPQRVDREQGAEAVKRWRKKDWPRIKKKRVGAVSALYLSMKPAFACNRIPRTWLNAMKHLKPRIQVTKITVYEFFRETAKLGGFLARKSDGEPGRRKTWHGYRKLQLIVHGIEIGMQIRIKKPG